jgi:hypothetical protein
MSTGNVQDPFVGSTKDAYSEARLREIFGYFGKGDFANSGLEENGNGLCLRLPEGLQLCAHRLVPGVGTKTWTYPKAFALAPWVFALPYSAPTNLIFSLTITGVPTTQQATFYLSYIDPAALASYGAAGEPLMVFALGRWVSEA